MNCGGHHQVGADVLLARQRLLVLGEPLLVVVEVFLVVHREAGWRSGRRRRNRRPCTAASSRCAACRWPVPRRPVRRRLRRRLAAVRSARGQEGRAERQRGRGGGAAADEPPSGGPVGGEPGSRRGSIASMFLEAMATVPFVDVREGIGDRTVEGVRSRRASPRDPRWWGCRRREAPARRRAPSRRAPGRRAAASAGPARGRCGR